MGQNKIKILKGLSKQTGKSFMDGNRTKDVTFMTQLALLQVKTLHYNDLAEQLWFLFIICSTNLIYTGFSETKN